MSKPSQTILTKELKRDRRQLLESQSRGSNHMAKGIQEQIGILPAIEPERHLVQVGGKMLCADLMPTSNDSTLQQGGGTIQQYCWVYPKSKRRERGR